MRRGCAYCGALLPSGNKTYCNRRCIKKAYRIRSLLRVAVRDHWTCQLCGKPVSITDTGTNTIDSPTRDHIIPRSVLPGPRLSQDQVQLAHGRCNSWRGDMPMSTWNQTKRSLAAGYYERSTA